MLPVQDGSSEDPQTELGDRTGEQNCGTELGDKTGDRTGDKPLI